MVEKTVKKVAKKKAVKKVKKMPAILSMPEIRKDVKPYKVLRTQPHEVRIYPPTRRTILVNGGGAHFLQLPYMILGFQPHKTGGFLFGCFSTQDLSVLSPSELSEAKVYMMPFPYQLDNGPWGPCCLIHHSPWYYFTGDFDALVKQFYQTSFRGLGDYGQKNVSCWNGMTFEQVSEFLGKSPQFYSAEFNKFLAALDYLRGGGY